MRCIALVLAAVMCCGMSSASPARQRRSLLEGVPLPDGVPIEVLFAACGGGAGEDDIGPCVEELLQGVIELATPSFASGIEVGGKTVILEPLALKDIEPKDKPGRKRKLKISGTNLQVAGISSLSVENVTLSPDELALTLNFSQLVASGDLAVRYSFIRASPQLVLTLNQPSFHVRSNWELAPVDGKLTISLSNVTVGIDIESFSTQIGGLSGLGGFLERLLNANNQILLDAFIPKLEEKAKRLLEKEFKTIKPYGVEPATEPLVAGG